MVHFLEWPEENSRDGAMKLKERCPNDLRFRFGILSSFSLEDRRERDVHKCREMKKDKEVKTHQNGGKQELQSYTDSGILLVTSEVP